MSATEQQQDFLMQRIEALEIENRRLNNLLIKVKENALKIRLTDPNFDRPLNEINVNFEIVEL
jgi:hypothetical protein